MSDAIRLTGPERAFLLGVPPQVTEILRCVSRESGVTVADILGVSRVRPVFRARALAMYLCRAHAGASHGDIARWFHRDPSSVAHALACVARDLAAFSVLPPAQSETGVAA